MQSQKSSHLASVQNLNLNSRRGLTTATVTDEDEPADIANLNRQPSTEQQSLNAYQSAQALGDGLGSHKELPGASVSYAQPARRANYRVNAERSDGKAAKNGAPEAQSVFRHSLRAGRAAAKLTAEDQRLGRQLGVKDAAPRVISHQDAVAPPGGRQPRPGEEAA